MAAKLKNYWPLVTLRGLVEGVLILALFLAELQTIASLNLLLAGVLVGGSVLELVMAFRMAGHPFRGILFFTVITGLALGGFLYYHHPPTLALLLIVLGLWISIRGFAALWLGLSIVTGTFEQLVPSLTGLAGLIGGGFVMLWLPAELDWTVALVGGYGIVGAVLHLLIAGRLFVERHDVTHS